MTDKLKKSGTLYLIPIPITEGALNTLSKDVSDCTLRITHYFVEQIRTTRRFLKQLHPKIDIDALSFSEIDKHNGADIPLFKKWLKEGLDIGIISESGCPGIADPGAELVAIAQSYGTNIIPLAGPNSMILALMASGLNGQNFCFRGYLPVKEPMRSKAIIDFELISIKEKQTQIFIETPYRNQHLFDDFLKNCQNKTWLCIAQNITAGDAFIKTKQIEAWKKDKPILGKVPAVFLILG